jgi:hypothetical protein
MSDYIEKLTQTVREKHGREAEHVITVPVKEVLNDLIVWEGNVEVFALRWNAKAKRCFAWAKTNGDGALHDIVTVLESRSVISPHSAVAALKQATQSSSAAG